VAARGWQLVKQHGMKSFRVLHRFNSDARL
jgi:hypothetical protein